MASNHLSHLDPVVLGVACPRKLNFMARHDLFLNRFFGGLISRLGAFPVRRNTADRSALKEAIERLNRGGGLLLFPEGTRQSAGTGDKDSVPQAGIGFLAAKVDVPVIPAYIKGTQAALPKGARRIKPGRVSVSFGEKINFERRLPYHEIAQVIMANITQLSC